MRFLHVALVVVVPAVVALAGGCMPLSAAFSDVGAGGNLRGGGGAGGSHEVTMTSGILPGTGGESSGSGAGTTLVSYAYLCGGSQATCSPDLGSSDCAPGGNPNMGGAGTDAGSKLTCHLVFDAEHVVAQCGLSGESGEGDPCNKATDCQAGHGCSATAVTGVCRQYCCGEPELCPQDTYCTPTTMADGAAQVPLCMPVTPCELLSDAGCKAGQACAIVRNDGTTSCITPGAGEVGDSCPCAAGYTCSSSGTCLKLCHVDGDECGTGTCQGGTLPYPTGIGYCVP